MVFAALEASSVRAESGDMLMPRPGTLGIVRECYSKWERRAPLTPTHVATLVKVCLPPSSTWATDCSPTMCHTNDPSLLGRARPLFFVVTCWGSCPERQETTSLQHLMLQGCNSLLQPCCKLEAWLQRDFVFTVMVVL